MTLTRVCRLMVPVALTALACSDPSGPGETITSLPRPLTVAEQKLIGGSNAFAFDLLRQVNTAQRGSNVFISPLSASMALGMTANGAAGSTYDAMRSTLRLGDASRQEINEGYKSLIALLRGLDKSTDFRIANSIWYEQTFPFNEPFLAESKSFFDAEVKGLDFTSPSALTTINSWVNASTNNKIPEILDDIDDAEVMFLINAIYFKGSWQKQFDKSKTAQAPFFALDGSTANVPLMHQSVPLRVARTSTYTAVDLLYGNSAYAMTVVLPNQDVSVNTLAESLTGETWKSLEESFSEHQSEFYFPRFKLEWKRVLNSDLRALGMGIAFDNADFTPMSPRGRELVITKVIQKTFVDVNEEGTEAAAATSVGVGLTSAPSAIRVDRPFLFVIRERFSGTIMFMGKIVKLPA
ncbi:MAG TPA: serpin family protein [Gemmatimonadaceae bacterium]|nr:serpin family protein [Gemmatimonadaceae bacterium]